MRRFNSPTKEQLFIYFAESCLSLFLTAPPLCCSETPWQHFRGRLSLPSLWPVSIFCTHTQTHSDILSMHGTAFLFVYANNFSLSCLPICPPLSLSFSLPLTLFSLTFPFLPSPPRVTGGELFEDIVAREYYSEADARWASHMEAAAHIYMHTHSLQQTCSLILLNVWILPQFMNVNTQTHAGGCNWFSCILVSKCACQQVHQYTCLAFLFGLMRHSSYIYYQA